MKRAKLEKYIKWGFLLYWGIVLMMLIWGRDASFITEKAIYRSIFPPNYRMYVPPVRTCAGAEYTFYKKGKELSVRADSFIKAQARKSFPGFGSKKMVRFNLSFFQYAKKVAKDHVDFVYDKEDGKIPEEMAFIDYPQMSEASEVVLKNLPLFSAEIEKECIACRAADSIRVRLYRRPVNLAYDKLIKNTPTYYVGDTIMYQTTYQTTRK